MRSPNQYLRDYLNGKGAVVKGAGITLKRPKAMTAPSDVTALMRRSFEREGRDRA